MIVDTLIHARWVIPVEPATVLEHHALAIKDGRILEFCSSAMATARYQARPDRTFGRARAVAGFGQLPYPCGHGLIAGQGG